jgi:hypothetical protein
LYALFQWGLVGDLPVVVDFDGDGRTELAVYRPTTGEWFMRLSTAEYKVALYRLYQWGLVGDLPVR